MKKAHIALVLALTSVYTYSQEIKDVKNEEQTTLQQQQDVIYNTAGIDVKPEYPGGLTAFYNFISANIKLPDTKGQTGKVFVTFVVEKDGELADIKVLRDIGFGTGDAVVKVLRQCRKWIPGEKNGNKVRVLYSLPIQINNK